MPSTSSRLPFLAAAGTLLLLFLVQQHSTPVEVHLHDAVPAVPTAASDADHAALPSDAAAADALGLHCGRLFIDGGSNTGESVAAFVKGTYFDCAMRVPFRVYRSAWPSLSADRRRDVMRPLSEPRSWCVRSFEAAPELLPPLRKHEERLKHEGYDVAFVDGALGNLTAAAAPREVVTYSRHESGASAVSMAFGDIHVEGKPAPLSTRTVRGASYDVRQLVRRALARNTSAVIALRLDIEGAEWWALEALLAADLLCPAGSETRLHGWPAPGSSAEAWR